MSAPTISGIERRWRLNADSRFHIKGHDFNGSAKVSLQDDRADWDIAHITHNDGSNIIFHSRPTRLHASVSKPYGPAMLTITVTNPDGTKDSREVAGTYE